MCHLCQPTYKLSRRRFLGWGAMTVLLTTCRAVEPVPPTASLIPTLTPTPPPTPTLRPVGMPLPQPTTVIRDLPQFAGQVAAVDSSSLTLAAPVGRRQFEMAVTTDVMVGDSTAIWVEGEQITAVQKLPPFSATEAIPEGWLQEEVTGEKRSLGPLELITRAGWGAGAANWKAGGEAGLFDPIENPGGQLIYPEPLSAWLNTLVVHHSALAYMDGPREIQRLHILQNGFADVGYHFFVDGLGQLYEGRPLNERGAHTGGYNTGTVGICLSGNFEVVQPVTAQLATLHQLAVYLRDTVGISHLTSHRDFQPAATICPGEHLQPLLPGVAEAVGLVWGTAGYIVPEWSG